MVLKKEKIEKLKKEARDHSIKEGIFASAKGSFGDYYISPFAIAINTSNSMVALLTSITGLLGPLSQTFGSRLLGKFSRKKIVLKFILLESLMWLPLIGLCFLYHKEIITNILPSLLLFLFALYTIFGNIAHPAWFSWMGDIVDPKRRGRWFSKRNLIMGFISVILAIIASFFLDFSKNKGWLMFGFIVLFSLAFLCRIIAWKIFHKQYEPKMKLKKTDYFSFWDFLINSPKNNFGKFALFRGMFGFATSICAPLIAVYLLRYLGFNYTQYMLITLGGTFISLFFLELWGKFADKYGNYKTLVFSSILIPIIPILWILSSSIIYLILIPSIISGIIWAGFHLGAGNFIYDNVQQTKRGLAVSYYNLILGIGIFLGAGLGALLIKFINTPTIAPIILVFIISAIVRFFMVILWLPKFKETQKRRKITNFSEIEKTIVKEFRPTLIEETHQIMSIRKYLFLK